MTHHRRHLRAARLWIALAMLLAASSILAGCGYDKEETAPTLPPATVISATQPAVKTEATAASPSQPTLTPLPMPPQLPAQQDPQGYPNPGLPPSGAQPVGPTATPIVYPTP